MLSDSEQREIDAELALCEYRRAALSEALKIVQRHRGWVSDEAVRDVAAALGLTAEEVDSVASFYSLIYRRPVGRHVILICDSVSCHLTGYEEVLRRLSQLLGIELGQTTADGRFTLLPAACLGLCEQAPAMMIDERVHGRLTPESLQEILRQHE
jgi:NADH-quinone oxidoreductase subunit E